MDSCKAIPPTNQRRAPTSIFFSSPCVGTQVSMQTTGFHTRLLKRIDILVAICSGGKENKNLSPHNVSPHNIIPAQIAQTVLCVQKRAMVLLFVPSRPFLQTHRASALLSDNERKLWPYSNNSYHYVCICTTRAYFWFRIRAFAL